MSITHELAPVDHAYAHVVTRQLVTSVGVAPGLLQELTSHDVGCLLMYSGTLEDMSRWVLADLLVWGEEQAAIRTGGRNSREFWDARDEMWDGLLKMCKSDISKHTAYNMAATARAFPWERRRHTETLSFEHHRIVCGRGEEEQELWLDMAEAGGWSVSRLRIAIHSDLDPLAPVLTVMSAPEIWPIEKVEREVYRAFELPTRWDTVERVKQLVIEIKGDVEHATKRKSYPRNQQGDGDG